MKQKRKFYEIHQISARHGYDFGAIAKVPREHDARVITHSLALHYTYSLSSAPYWFVLRFERRTQLITGAPLPLVKYQPPVKLIPD